MGKSKQQRRLQRQRQKKRKEEQLKESPASVFISYKTVDSKDFSVGLARELKDRQIQTWFDDVSLLPGDSIIGGIERGLSDATLVVLIISKNYFSGWSDQERKAALQMMISSSKKLVPIWYDVDEPYVRKQSLLLSDVKAIPVSSKNSSLEESLSRVVTEIAKLIDPKRVPPCLPKLNMENAPPLPDGYLWEYFREPSFAIARPYNWHVYKKNGSHCYTYIISKESVKDFGSYETGWCLRFWWNVRDNSGFPPSVIATLNLKEKTLEPYKEVLNSAMGEVNGHPVSIVRTRDYSPGAPPIIIEHQILADDVQDIIYEMLFESPESSWDTAWKIGDVMMKMICIVQGKPGRVLPYSKKFRSNEDC